MNRKLRPFLEPFKSNFPPVKASKYTYFKFCVHCFSALMFVHTQESWDFRGYTARLKEHPSDWPEEFLTLFLSSLVFKNVSLSYLS